MAAVMSVARECFFNAGYGATRMDDIAKRAGVSKRSLYLWHSDKAALFRAVINESAKKLKLPGLNPALSLQQNIEQYSFALLSGASEKTSFAIGRILGREGWQSPDLEKMNLESLKVIETPLHEILTHFGTGSLQVPRVARYFIAMLMTEHQDRMMLDIAPLTEEEIREEVQHVVVLFVGGLIGLARAAP